MHGSTRVLTGASVLLWLGGCGVLQGPGAATHALSSAAVLASVKVGRGPTLLAMSPDGARVFAASIGTLTIIRTDTNTVVSTRKIDPYPTGIAVTPNGRRLLLTTISSARLAVLDAATGVRQRLIALPQNLQPGGYGRIAVSPDGRTALVANEDSWLAIVNLTAGTARRDLLDMRPRDVGFGTDGGTVYLAGCKTFCTSGTVEQLDPAGWQTLRTLTVGPAPYRVALSPDGATAYTTNLGGPSLSVVDLASGAVKATVPVGIEPTGLAVSPDGARIYVVSQTSATLTIVSAAGNTVLGTAQVPGAPREIVVTPDGRRAYVSTSAPNAVVVLDTARLVADTTS
jgi:YVTN family beta-propeller protein